MTNKILKFRVNYLNSWTTVKQTAECHRVSFYKDEAILQNMNGTIIFSILTEDLISIEPITSDKDAE